MSVKIAARTCVTSATAASLSPALVWFVGLLDAVGSRPRGALARQCPSHADAAPSLAIAAGDGGQVLLHCHAGCSADAILRALAVPWARLWRPPMISPSAHAATFCRTLTFPPVAPSRTGSRRRPTGMRLESEHAYGDRWWLVRHRHPITGEKTLEWESRNARGERVPGLLGTATRDLPLYRQRDIMKGIALGEPVLLVESESSVDALRGWYATTWAGGAASPPLGRIADVLGGADVVVIPDHDRAGLACLDRLLHALPYARVLLGDDGEDARDLFRRVGPGFRIPCRWRRKALAQSVGGSIGARAISSAMRHDPGRPTGHSTYPILHSRVPPFPVRYIGAPHQ